MDGRRRILLERAVNVRDLGGYPRRDGGATPYGRFYRADNMHGLTSGDMEELYGLGLRTVLDLRTPGECAAQPTVLRASGMYRCCIIRCWGRAPTSSPVLCAVWERITPK